MGINEQLKKEYEEGMFDLDSYSSKAVKDSRGKVDKYVQSLELRLAMMEGNLLSNNLTNESLDKIIFHAKYSKTFEPKFKKEWFREAITLWMEGYTFDGIFFRKGENKVYYKSFSNGIK